MPVLANLLLRGKNQLAADTDLNVSLTAELESSNASEGGARGIVRAHPEEPPAVELRVPDVDGGDRVPNRKARLEARHQRWKALRPHPARHLGERPACSDPNEIVSAVRAGW